MQSWASRLGIILWIDGQMNRHSRADRCLAGSGRTDKKEYLQRSNPEIWRGNLQNRFATRWALAAVMPFALALILVQGPRRNRLEIGAPDDPFDMRRRREAARTSGDHLRLRSAPLRRRHAEQAAHETSGRFAATSPMPTAAALRAAAPECERIAIKPPRRDVRGIDLRAACLETAPLEEVLLGRRFVAP
jgi:hypothetical protein